MTRHSRPAWRRRAISSMQAFIAMRDVVFHLWERLVLAALVRGFKLPGSDSIHGSLSQQRQDELERRILVREIKRSRQLVPHGPLWMSARLESVLRYLEGKRPLFLVSLKIFIALFVIVIPVTGFMIIRGVLPVPTRIPFHGTSAHLSRQTNLRVDWPYTVAPFSTRQVERVQAANLLSAERFRGANVSSLIERSVPPGLVRISVGDYPSRVESFRGFLVSERAPLQVFRQQIPRIDIAGQNRMQVRTFLFPTSDSGERCRLEVRNEEGELLLVSEAGSQASRTSANTIYGKDFRERLTPQALRRGGGVAEYSIETDDPAEALTLAVTRVGGEDEHPVSEPNSVAPVSYPLSVQELLARGGVARDLSNDRCVFGVGHFAYEKTMVSPLKRRGIVLIAVDFLRSAVVGDAALMPNVRRYFSNGGAAFEQHYSTGNTATIAMPALLASRPYGDFVRALEARKQGEVPSLEGWNSLPSLFVEAGYRAMAIGRLSAEDRNPWPESVLIQNRHYESRSITEEAANWLEEYGQEPFLLYLHYGTFHPPFRPPFDRLNLSRFLSNPFGLGGERELEAGLGRSWDFEFSLLMRKLEMLGISNDVDVMLLSTHGAQVEPLPYGNVLGAPADLVGAVRSEGPLADDELHVPLLIRLASDASRNAMRVVSSISSHLDIAPTLAELAGLSARPSTWQGNSLLSQVAGEQGLNRVGAGRSWLYAESPIAAAVFRPAGVGTSNGVKLIRFFSPFDATTFMEKAPWRRDFRWAAGEVFGNVELASRREEWSQYQRGLDKQWARRALMESLTAPVVLSISRPGGGDLDVTFRFAAHISESDLPRVVEVPLGVKFERRDLGSGIEIRLSGLLAASDVVRVVFLPKMLSDMTIKGVDSVHACGGNMPAPGFLVESIRAGLCLDFKSKRTGSEVFVGKSHFDHLEIDVDLFRGKEEEN